MSNKNTPEAQFSIYKINFEAVEKLFSDISHGTSEDQYADNVIYVLINSIASLVFKKPASVFHEIKYNDFNGIIFKTTHYPIWNDVAKELLSNNELMEQSKDIDDTFLTNTNISYVYFYSYKGKVFAVTGGYGSNYITKFIDKWHDEVLSELGVGER